MTDTQLINAWLKDHEPQRIPEAKRIQARRAEVYFCCMTCRHEVNLKFYVEHLDLHYRPSLFL